MATAMVRITIDDLKEEIGVTDAQLNLRCTKMHLSEVAQFVDNYFSFASKFNIPEADLRDIEINQNLNFRHKTEKVFFWWHANMCNATYQSFMEVCIELNKGDLARKMCQLCAEGFPSLSSKNCHISPGPSFMCPFCQIDTLKQHIENGCPKASQINNYPYLKTHTLSEEVRLKLESILSLDAQEMIQLFADVEAYILESLKTNARLSSVKSFVMSLISSVEDKEKIEKVDSVSSLFLTIKHYKSFLNYTIIETIVDRFGSAEAKSSMEKYGIKFTRFCQKKFFEIPRFVFLSEEINNNTNILSLKVHTIAKDTTLSLSEAISARENIASIFGFRHWELRICSIKDECLICIQFLLAKDNFAKLFPLSTSKLDALKLKKIEIVTSPTIERPDGTSTSFIQLSSIEIDGEVYDLKRIPDMRSGVVLAEKEILIAVIDLKTFIKDLKYIGKFISIAYNGVNAVGPKLAKRQLQIQELRYDVIKLWDNTALTLENFKISAHSIFTKLNLTYEFLLKNLEGMAFDTLSTISKLADEMQTTANELRINFDKLQRNITEVLTDTQESKQSEAMLSRKRKRDIIEMEEMKQSLHIQIREYQQKQSKTRCKSQDLEEQKHHEIRSRLRHVITKIKQYQEEENMADIAVDVLHEAISALKHLSVIAMQAELFWEQIRDHCKYLAKAENSEIKSLIEKALECYTKEERFKIWTSSPFKHKAVNFFASWVAFHEVCNDYIEQSKMMQRDFYSYISENPTCEESRSNLKKLVASFLDDLKATVAHIN